MSDNGDIIQLIEVQIKWPPHVSKCIITFTLLNPWVTPSKHWWHKLTVFSISDDALGCLLIICCYNSMRVVLLFYCSNLSLCYCLHQGDSVKISNRIFRFRLLGAEATWFQLRWPGLTFAGTVKPGRTSAGLNCDARFSIVAWGAVTAAAHHTWAHLS